MTDGKSSRSGRRCLKRQPRAGAIGIVGEHIEISPSRIPPSDEVLDTWHSLNKDRKDSASHRLPALLVEQPVVNTAYVAQALEVSDRTARTLVERACERGILTKMGHAHRGAFYQASGLIDILEEASSLQGIRRIAAR